ncbi:MAG: hypothetical protein NHB14_15105 [Desulfosporosinus sp.]|nr:hypothetical protein [Desulfosporosinus sp.]
MFDEEEIIEPIDMCGCGDMGYLTAKTIPIDLAHGPGRVANVPVYHCRAASCQEYTLPSLVSRRLEVIAEQMEEERIKETAYTWENKQESTHDKLPEPALAPCFILATKFPYRPLHFNSSIDNMKMHELCRSYPDKLCFFRVSLKKLSIT